MTTRSTRLGDLNGIRQGDVDVYLGIPYAMPPVGDLRFKAPVAAGGWVGVRDATVWGNRSLQVDGGITGTPNGELDEDCLVLNVYCPVTGAAERPVLFWIHGGAFTLGSANSYDGSVLAAQGDAVIVTINYRLGLLGFMDLSRFGSDYQGSASNGIRDCILGLEWVRDNIVDFGGDPGNVTIFGESAGGAIVNCLLSAPSADGLYHRAIAHSGGTPSTPPVDGAGPLSGHLGIEPGAVLDQLLALSGEEVLALQIASGFGGSGSSIDGVVVTRTTPDALRERGDAGVPYIAGSNKDEGTLFTTLALADASGAPDFDQVLATMGRNLATATMDGADPTAFIEGLRSLYPDASSRTIYEHIWNDMFRRATINNALAASEAGPGGWVYRFDLPSTLMGGNLGATHASEIPFTFNNFASDTPAEIAFHDGKDPVVRDLAERWSNTVLAFARTGDPNGGGLASWSRYDQSGRASLVMDAECQIAGPELDEAHQRVWGDA